MYSEQLALSGIQHFSFCRRQWALIHVEKQWKDNVRTVDGNIMHKKAHDSSKRERRGDVLILRDLSIFSDQIGFTGKCDVVEFHLSEEGIKLHGEDGRWQPYPVEYKRGEPKAGNEDKLQLCAQAMCLEEMLCCKIEKGALFYGETRRRLEVYFDEFLRDEVMELSREMHKLFIAGHTPLVKRTKACNACSLKEICLPVLTKKKDVNKYIEAHIVEGEGD